MNWKIDSFVKNVTGQVFDSGKQIIINESDFVGKTCYVRISVKRGDKPKADGTYPEFSNCEDVLDPDEARAIMAEQARVEAARKDRQATANTPPRPDDLPANNHMSATAGLPLEDDDIPF